MGLFQIPDPVSMFESAQNAKLERAEAVALISATLSATITFFWSAGSSKIAGWLGLGPALKDAATVTFLTLQQKQVDKTPLTLTVPQELLAANNLSRFQTQETKKS